MTELETAIQTFLNHGVDAKALHRTIQGDLRAAKWRVRMRLFDKPSAGQCIADTDPELGADSPGADVVSGLHGVADWAAGILAEMTREPQAAIAGALRAKVPSLRVALARDGSGRALWRFVYPSARYGELPFTVHVTKASEAPGVARRVA